jgi:hypothetical protein
MKSARIKTPKPWPNGPAEERQFVKQNQKIRSPFRAALHLTIPAVSVLTLACFSPLRADPGKDNREPELSADCAAIKVPDGNKVASHVYAVGVQIYRWTGSSWAFVAPSASLYANADYDGQMGTHYVGPTWESNSGSKVVGTRLAGCTPDRGAIPWLLLQAISTEGSGTFHEVTYIQRVNTVGGIAPTTPGSAAGEEVKVAYTAEYFFYRATNR